MYIPLLFLFSSFFPNLDSWHLNYGKHRFFLIFFIFGENELYELWGRQNEFHLDYSGVFIEYKIVNFGGFFR